MIQPLTVNVGHRVRNVDHQLGNLCVRRLGLGRIFAEIAAGHVLLDDVRPPRIFVHTQHRHDAWMAEVQRLAGLLQELRAHLALLRPSATQHFRREVLARLGIAHLVDDAKCPVAQLAHHLVWANTLGHRFVVIRLGWLRPRSFRWWRQMGIKLRIACLDR